MTSEISTLSKHIENAYYLLWNKWIKQERDWPKGERQFKTIYVIPTLSTIYVFFGNEMF
jgi:hypothetical protein